MPLTRDAWQHVFSLLDADALFTVRQVCRKWREIGSMHRLWIKHVEQCEAVLGRRTRGEFIPENWRRELSPWTFIAQLTIRHCENVEAANRYFSRADRYLLAQMYLQLTRPDGLNQRITADIDLQRIDRITFVDTVSGEHWSVHTCDDGEGAYVQLQLAKVESVFF